MIILKIALVVLCVGVFLFTMIWAFVREVKLMTQLNNSELLEEIYDWQYPVYILPEVYDVFHDEVPGKESKEVWIKIYDNCEDLIIISRARLINGEFVNSNGEKFKPIDVLGWSKIINLNHE